MEESVTGRDVDVESSGLIQELYNGAFLRAMVEDFKNLVAWAHSHSTICPYIPSPKDGHRMDEVNTFVLPFHCTAGHAYNWPVMALSGTVVETKSILGRIKRKRTSLQAEEEVTGLAEEADDLSAAREQGPAELDDSQGSLLTNVSGEQSYDTSGEHKDAPTSELPKATNKRQKIVSSSTWVPEEQASTSSTSLTEHRDPSDFPQFVQLAETAIEHIKLLNEDLTANMSALDDSSMHIEDLGSVTDGVSEDEVRSSSQGGRGNATPGTPSRAQQRSQSEGHLSPVTPGSPSAGSSTSTASSSTADKSKKKKAAASKRASGILGSVCSNLMNFQAWRTLMYPDDSRSLGGLDLPELDALLAAYLHYLWEGSHRHLTHDMLVQQARGLDRHLKLQGCLQSVQRPLDLHVSHEALEKYCQALHERETELHGAVIRSVTAAEEEELRGLGVLGRATPEALLHLVLYNNTRAFGPAHLYRTWPLPVGKFHHVRVVLAADANANASAAANLRVLDCLEWADPVDPEQAPLRMLENADDPLRCPLKDFRIYATKHPGGLLNQNDAFYTNQRSAVDAKARNGWYSRTPMSKLRLGKAIGGLAQRIETMRYAKGAKGPV